MNPVFEPVAGVLRLILPSVGTEAMLLAFSVLALVLGVIVPVLDSLTVLKVIFPVALVGSSIAVGVLSVSMSFISLPLSFVLVTVHMPKDSLAVCFVVLPVPLVLGSIWPDLYAISMSDVAFPLTLVPSTVLEDELSALLTVFKVIWFALLTLVIPIFLLSALIELVASEISTTNHGETLVVVVVCFHWLLERIV